MNQLEQMMNAELEGMLRAGVPARGVRLTMRELVVARIERGRLGAYEVGEAVDAAVRAACRLVRELDAPPEIVESVCRGALDAVRGHGGESARWMAEAIDVASALLEAQASTRRHEGGWHWLLDRVPQW